MVRDAAEFFRSLAELFEDDEATDVNDEDEILLLLLLLVVRAVVVVLAFDRIALVTTVGIFLFNSLIN